MSLWFGRISPFSPIATRRLKKKEGREREGKVDYIFFSQGPLPPLFFFSFRLCFFFVSPFIRSKRKGDKGYSSSISLFMCDMGPQSSFPATLLKPFQPRTRITGQDTEWGAKMSTLIRLGEPVKSSE